MRSRALLAGTVATAAAILAGCGLGPGQGTSNVSVTVTRSFGQKRIAQVSRSKVPGSETVMRMLERSFRVNTRYGGGFVQSINGLGGSGSRLDWFYYVNGVEAPQGAATTAVHRGDHIWWDLHDWTATNSVPAVVGAFPEPFVHGTGGKRFPTSLACGPDAGLACRRAAAALHAVGVPAASQLLGTGSGSDTLTVDVGTWQELRPQLIAGLIAVGPSASGVYAKFASAGAALQLLDPAGHVVRTLGPGAGLIAATAYQTPTPTWLITGTDATGVARAAAAFNQADLRDHFAVAVDGHGVIPLPLRAGS